MIVGLSLSLSLSGELMAQGQGQWYPAYNWRVPSPTGSTGIINVIHAGVIPIGPNQGKVIFLSWDRPSGTTWQPTTWGILDPEAQPNDGPPLAAAFVHDASESVPMWDQATCVGQSWTPDGRWFIAGGQMNAAGAQSHNTGVPSRQGFGSFGAWIYDPNVAQFGGPNIGAWFREDDLAARRYYPTVMLSQLAAR